MAKSNEQKDDRVATQLNGDLLRAVARSTEENLRSSLRGFSEATVLPVLADLQYSSRSSPELRAAARGFELLRDRVDEAIAILYALATLADRGVPLADPLLVLVKPYIDGFRVQRERETEKEKR